MSYEGKGPQMSGQPERPRGSRGEAPKTARGEEEPTAAGVTGRSGASGLMERALEAANLKAALARVRKNKGSPEIDGMRVEELPEYLREHRERQRSELLRGAYRPQPVRRVKIPKPGGGKRPLGIPTVLDRFIQQALLQVLQPRIDPSFSPHSYGLRPGRSAHDAVRQAQRYVRKEAELIRSIFKKQVDLEALLSDHILLRLRNVYITPHSAFNTREALGRILETTAENIRRFIAGIPQNCLG